MLDYLDDLDADFRVFYRIDGIAEGRYGDLTGPQFFRLANRTFHYRGVMRDRVMVEQNKSEEESKSGFTPTEITRNYPHAHSSSTSSMWSGEVKEVPLAQLRALHPGIVEHRTVG